MSKISARGSRVDWELVRGASWWVYVDVTNFDGSEPDFTSGYTAWAEIEDADGTTLKAFTIAGGQVSMADGGTTNRIALKLSEDETMALAVADFADGASYQFLVKRTSDGFTAEIHYGSVKLRGNIAEEP